MKTLLTTALLSLTLAVLSAAEPKPAPKLIRMVLVGDSTVAVNQGWGPGFSRYLSERVLCLNYARNGRSSKSFRNEGHWQAALAEHPDYVLIQFGHNDFPGKGPERETDPNTTFREFMGQYVDEARAAGAKPVLVTSLTRRIWRDGKVDSNLGPYVEAVQKLAAEKSVPLLDLHARSIELFDRLGPQAGEELEPPRSDGKPGPDHTHLSAKGSDVVGQLVAKELRRVVPDLAPYLRIPVESAR